MIERRTNQIVTFKVLFGNPAKVRIQGLNNLEWMWVLQIYLQKLTNESKIF